MISRIDLGIPGFTEAEEIGRGGFGTVFRARQESVGRIVAVKVLSAVSISDDTLKRFERECRAMAAVSSHPHITALYDSGVAASGRPYIVMEYASAGSVAAQLPLPWPAAVEIGVKLAGALETAHRIGIYHRDVKPENVLLSGYGEPVLADFGVAKVADSSATPSGNITASLLHAAPETLSGARPSATTDVYSLASTVFALITGRAPFAGEHDEESLAPLIARIATADVPDLRPHGVPDAVCAALERGLAKDPLRRPASPAELGEQLREAQLGSGLQPTTMLVEGVERVPTGELAVSRDAEDTVRRSRSQVLPVVLREAKTEPDVRQGRHRWTTVAACAAALVLLIGGGALAVNATMERRASTAPMAAAEPARPASAAGEAAAVRSTEPAAPEPVVAPEAFPPAGITNDPGGAALAPPPPGTSAGGGTTSIAGGNPGTANDTTNRGPARQQAPPPTQPLPPPPPPPPVVAPGEPADVQSRDVKVVSRKGGDPNAAAETVSVLTSWRAASGTSPSYCVQWTVMTGGSTVNAGPRGGGCTTATSLRVTIPHVFPADSWVRWEVRATNSAGASSWVPASVVVPQLVGGTSIDGTQFLRAAGMRVSYNRLGNPPPGVENYSVTGQSPRSGTVLGGGAYVRMDFYETY